MSSLFLAILVVHTNPVARYFTNIFRKDPFRGLYQPNWFDRAFAIPYFTILIVLSIYGLHRCYLIYLYLKNRHRLPAPRSRFEELPRITIQLPVYNERYVVERLLEAVGRIDYPRDRLEIQVLDDSTDETRLTASRLVEEYALAGYPIRYIHRDHREGFKAGALAEGLKSATGEFIAIFDADFVPSPSILHDLIHYFTDPRVAVAQGRWTWINRHYSNLTEVEAMMLDGHFVIEHGARSAAGRFFNFNGTGGIWRRTAIDDAGGWQHDTLTEDTDLSYRAQLKGWKFIYDPRVACPSELPVEINAFKSQQSRWAKGLIQTAKKLLPEIWRSSQPLAVKVEATFHLTANIAYPLMVLLSVILLPAMIVRFYQGLFQMVYLDIPLFLASSCSVASFYVLAQRELDARRWLRRLKYIPFLMATGVGLAVTNAKAVVEAALGARSEFVRTTKYCVEERDVSWESNQYVHRRRGWIPLIELTLAGYFLFTTVYSVTIENYLTTPFLMIFLGGNTYMGMMSLFQAPLRRLWTALPSLIRPRTVAPATEQA